MPARNADGLLTRRRALILGAAAGLGATVARPLRALGRRSAAPRGFGLRVTPADFPGGGATSRVLRTRRFDLVGLRGARGDVEVRVRRAGGRWSAWVALAVHGDHAPDTGSGERASDPVWTGGSDELQLRVRGGRPRRDLRVHLVTVPASARRRFRRPRARAAQVADPHLPPPIIGRDAWGAAAVPPRTGPSYGDVQLAYVHHTVTTNSYGPQDSAAMVVGIAKFHRDTNGWNDIGYNFLVDQYGQIFEGRAGGIDQPVIGAHTQGFNSHSTGVAILGTFTSAPPSAAALDAVARIVAWKLSIHGAPIEGTVVVTSAGGDVNRWRAGTPVTFQRISGHRDADATSCPGNALYALLGDIRVRARPWTFTPVAAAPAVQASLPADRTAVPYRSPAVFRGNVVRADGTPAVGAPVFVQKRGRTAWVTVGQTTVDATGA